MHRGVMILIIYPYYFVCSILLGQGKKSLTINRVTEAPKIDGILDDEAWKNADEAKDFTQFRPEMGVKEIESQRTLVKLVYTDSISSIKSFLKSGVSLVPNIMMRRG